MCDCNVHILNHVHLYVATFLEQGVAFPTAAVAAIAAVGDCFAKEKSVELNTSGVFHSLAFG